MIDEMNENSLIKGIFASLKNNNIKGAELLIKKGANINKENKYYVIL